MLFGSPFHVFSYEWKRSYFRFREPYADLAYALETDKVLSDSHLDTDQYFL